MKDDWSTDDDEALEPTAQVAGEQAALTLAGLLAEAELQAAECLRERLGGGPAVAVLEEVLRAGLRRAFGCSCRPGRGPGDAPVMAEDVFCPVHGGAPVEVEFAGAAVDPGELFGQLRVELLRVEEQLERAVDDDRVWIVVDGRRVKASAVVARAMVARERALLAAFDARSRPSGGVYGGGPRMLHVDAASRAGARCALGLALRDAEVLWFGRGGGRGAAPEQAG